MWAIQTINSLTAFTVFYLNLAFSDKINQYELRLSVSVLTSNNIRI